MSISVRRNKFGIETLVNNILDEFPNSIWTSSTTTFLDPAMGGGQFLKEIIRRLAEAGHSTKNIKARVFGYETNRFAIRDAKYKLGNMATIEKKDFINDEINMNFDVVIGNPPYNKGIKLGSNAENAAGYPHLAFMNAALKLTKEGGLVSFIMPVSFMTLPSCHDWRNDILSKGTFKYITLIDNRKNEAFDIKFPWVCNVIFQPGKSESKITYDIISNKPSDTISLNLNDYTYLDNDVKKTTWPLFTTYYIKTIFDKVRAQSKKLDRPMPRELKTGLSKPYISYMVQGYDTRPVVNDIPKAKATGENIRGEAYLYFDTDADAYKYCDFMNSKLFSMLLECTTGTGKTQPMSIQQIGNFDFSNVNTNDDQELYKFFNLDADEIAYIESY